MSFVATAIVGAGALGAGASIFGATEQAGAEKTAANTIASTTQQGIQSLLGLVSPFTSAAQSIIPTLTSLLTPGTATQTLQQLPGYQFSLNTGMWGINNAATTSGLGGNVLTAANNYAQGTAQGTYSTLLNNLLSLFGSGASAAGSAGNQISQLTAGAGQNIAQTQVGAANAIAGGVTGATSSLGSSLTTGLLLSKLLGGGGASSSLTSLLTGGSGMFGNPGGTAGNLPAII